MHRRSVILAFAAVAVLAGLTGCHRTPAPARAGESPRYVILSPALAIMARELRPDLPIVGRHAWDMVLDKSIPVCGDQAGIDYEALITARPTHILLEWGRRELPARLTDLARRHGWTVTNYTLLTLDEIRESARRLYAELVVRAAPAGGPAPPPWEESALARGMARAWSPRPGPAGEAIRAAGRVLILETVNPAHALGPGSFHHQILRAIGARPVPEEGAPYIEMDAEDVLHLGPDAIILIEPRNPEAPPRPGPFTAEEIREKLGPLARLDIPAVKTGRVAVIDDPLALTPSTAMIGLADDLAALLEAWGASTPPR